MNKKMKYVEWKIKINCDEPLDDYDLEYIAKQVEQGFTSGDFSTEMDCIDEDSIEEVTPMEYLKRIGVTPEVEIEDLEELYEFMNNTNRIIDNLPLSSIYWDYCLEDLNTLDEATKLVRIEDRYFELEDKTI